ncbi:hypothetical protein [Hyalangium rubrum]|uniref:Uncharacterized protein n=1 Tax=Hyalangium rubrum TaxID=3103134 RepID=A0ABU5GY67_9BACT|nr:hypothetical protein [Hyalangium sp. s54d21]MDY7226129.1 hypothetical protein [Hyalangium sp. s54d21]
MASLPEGLPPLTELIQEALAPGAARAEVDKLLAGLAEPPPPEPDLREHADRLLSLIEDKHLGDFTGSDGRTVRAAAVQALVSLGYPYALEVPPEALDASELRASRGAADSSSGATKQKVGLGIISVLGLGELLPAIVLANIAPTEAGAIFAWSLLFISLTTLVPTLLLLIGREQRMRFLQGLGTVWLSGVGLLWMVPGIYLLLREPLGLIPMGIGALTLLSAVLMNTGDD